MEISIGMIMACWDLHLVGISVRYSQKERRRGLDILKFRNYLNKPKHHIFYSRHFIQAPMPLKPQSRLLQKEPLSMQFPQE